MKRKRQQEDKDLDIASEEIDNEDKGVENTEEADVTSEDDTKSPEPTTSTLKPNAPAKKKKRGIIYLSTIPKHMTVSIARDMFSQYADVGRMFFQPSKKSNDGIYALLLWISLL